MMLSPASLRAAHRTIFAAAACAAMACAAVAAPQLTRAAASATSAALPADSIYHLAATLTDQDGRSFRLADRRGRPMVVSMFYTSCQFVCPMLVETLHATLRQLGDAERDRVDVLMVSLDPERDTVAVLKSTAEQRGATGAHWTLARTDAASVRKLAAVLGIQYRQLPSGEFNHSTDIVLVDTDGRIAGRTAQLGRADPAFVKLVKKAADKPGAGL